jgi:hypothetical protein
MKKTKILKSDPISVVGDGLVSITGRGEGRPIPSIIIDTSHRPDIDDLIRAHENLRPGDAASQWGTAPLAKASIVLNLRFLKPMQCEFAIAFVPYTHTILIDAILHAQALYLIAGRTGDKLSTTMNHPKIIVEVPRSVFADKWDKRMPKIVAQRFRAQGLTRKEARSAARDKMNSIREMWSMRQG